MNQVRSDVESVTSSGTSPSWHTLTVPALEATIGTSSHGLSPEEVRARLARFGPNQLEEDAPPSAIAVLLRQFKSPLIYILLGATVITAAVGEYIDVAVIGVVLGLNTIIGFTQERRAEASVRALMRLAAPHARVIRDGREWEVESRDLVPGDLVLLESGVRIPADLRLIAVTALAIDESLLTGESIPATKQTAPLPADLPVGDQANMAFMGTVVTSGRGRGYVVATGSSTALGEIATTIREEEEGATPLQDRMDRFARVIAIAVVVASALAVGIGVAQGESVTEMFHVAVSLAIAAVPEGLPVIFTITLALGVRRMARRNAIVRRLPAVETLGSTTVIGSDKTGTLTENRMTVQTIWAGSVEYSVVPTDDASAASVLVHGDAVRLPEHQPLYLTLVTGVLTNEAEIYLTDDGYESQGDPTEAALLIAAARFGIEPEVVRNDYPLYAEIPFESERQYSASIRVHEGKHVAFVKGAPERVLAMCATMLTNQGEVDLNADQILEAAHMLAGRGLRVLAMAYRPLPAPHDHAEAVWEPEHLTFLGLQGMLDPPRPGVADAIAGCQAAGIRVIMITGDHVTTARAIGRQLGIAGPDAPALTGAELALMSDEDLRARVQEVPIYARVPPEHKLRVVQALQYHDEVVAVTGDGVNDAPALKAADIGIAMGKSGTDVARDAADMVLTDDNFVSIYAAVDEGRVTFDNLRKATFFLVSTGVAAIVALLAALMLRWPLPFLPAQLIWLNLVTNGLQDIALAFEPGERGLLRRPPRPRNEGMLSPLLWERTVVTGLVMAVGTLALFRWEVDRTESLAQAQTVALTTMVLFQNFHVGNCRSERLSVFQKSLFSNPFLLLAAASALVVHVAALYFPPAQYVLRIEPIGLDAWVRIVLVASSIIVAVELDKLVHTRLRPARHATAMPTT